MSLGKKSVLDIKMMTLNLMWGSLISSVFIFAGLGYFLIAEGGSAEPIIEKSVADMIIFGMGAMAVVMIGAGYKIPEFLAKQQPRNIILPTTSYDDKVESESISGQDQRAVEFFPRYLTICLVRWSFFESVAIMGLVTLMLAGQAYLAQAGAFIALSVGFLVITRPSVVELKSLAKVRKGF